MRKIITHLILIGLLFLVSCDGPYENCPATYFTQEVKDEIFYNKGSYWIYKDSISNVIDTLSLLESGVSFNSLCKYNTLPGEYFSQKMTSSYFTKSTPFTFGGEAQQFYFDSGSPYIFYNTESYFPFQLGKLDSLKVNNVIYRNIRICQTAIYINPDTLKNKYYWVSKKGMIKREFYEGANRKKYVFNLIDSSIK